MSTITLSVIKSNGFSTFGQASKVIALLFLTLIIYEFIFFNRLHFNDNENCLSALLLFLLIMFRFLQFLLQIVIESDMT